MSQRSNNAKASEEAFSDGKTAAGYAGANEEDAILACLMADSPSFPDDCRALITSRHAWIPRIREGFSGQIAVGLASKMRVAQKDMAGWLHTSPRTLQRYVEGKGNLSPEISDRLAQLILVYCRCNEVLKDEEKVAAWLKSANYALGGVTPLSLLDTMVGIELVLDELGRIEHGVFI